LPKAWLDEPIAAAASAAMIGSATYMRIGFAPLINAADCCVCAKNGEAQVALRPSID
jgi:hypothetical protein